MSLCSDCLHSDLADWEEDAKTGKAKAIYWCKKNNKICNSNTNTNICDDYISCNFDDFLDELDPCSACRSSRNNRPL